MLVRLYRPLISCISPIFFSRNLHKSTTDVKYIVDSAITENKITIFSKSWCPYCESAKGIFASKFADVTTKVFELDERADGDEIQEYLREKSGQSTVPNVFINTEHIGGSDDVVALDEAGELENLVRAYRV